MNRRPSGFRGFSIFWVGQLLSLLGSNMTNFGLTIWAFGQTGRATDLALIGLSFMLPMIVLGPIGGALVDRHDRRWMMILSDLGSGFTTIVGLVLYSTGTLEIWHLFILAAVSGTFQSFQWPAFSAALTLMVPKAQYTRANSMMHLAGSGSNVFAPIAAGALIGTIGLRGILIIDIVTFSFAVGALLIIDVPSPEPTARSKESGALFKESIYGFRYIIERPPLLKLQSVFLVGNFFVTMSMTLLPAMILARTGNNELLLGSVQTIGAIGGIVGGIAISAWGGFKRNVIGVLTGWLIGLAPLAIMAFGRGSPYLQTILIWGGAMFVASFGHPLVNASNQSIWMSKVPPDVQGRVFAARRMVAWLVIPLAQLIAGPLADEVAEPLMMPGGALARVFEPLIGSGPGAGMGLIFLVVSLLGSITMVFAFTINDVRNVESLLPDHTPDRDSVSDPPTEDESV